MIIYLEDLALKIAYKIAKILAKVKITPNQVTIARFIISFPLSWYFFSQGKYLYNIIGLLFYMLLAILDWVDGKLARITKTASTLGKFVDDILDRILILIVLGAIFYAGIMSKQSNIWIILALIYYSLFFFITVLLYEFDLMFDIDFKRYPTLEKEVYKINKSPSLTDRILYNILYVHKNSSTKFCFTVSYPLFIGIIINQMTITFIFITSMLALRSLGIMYIMYLAVKRGSTHSLLARTLRKSMRKNEDRHEIVSRIKSKEDRKYEDI